VISLCASARRTVKSGTRSPRASFRRSAAGGRTRTMEITDGRWDVQQDAIFKRERERQQNAL